LVVHGDDIELRQKETSLRQKKVCLWIHRGGRWLRQEGAK
jgi:hypothetical protein